MKLQMKNVEKCTADLLFKTITKYIHDDCEFTVIVIKGLEWNGETMPFQSIKNYYGKDLFFYDSFFNTSCLWAGYNCSTPNSYDKHFINNVKQHKIIFCDKCYDMDLPSLNRLKNVMEFCNQYKQKKIFILNCLLPLNGDLSQKKLSIVNNLIIKLPCKIIQLLPLLEESIKKELNQEPAYSALNDDQKKEVLGWINNEYTLIQVVEAIRALTQQNIDFAEYLRNNRYQFVYDNLQHVYLAILSTLELQLRETLDIATASGFQFYSKLLEKLNPKHFINLKEIEANTKLVVEKEFCKGDYVFLNKFVYNLILSMIDNSTLRNYQLNLAGVAHQLYESETVPSIRLFILEKMNEYLKSSTNINEKKHCLYQLINEYNKYFMFAECLDIIENTGIEYKNDDFILYNRAKCYLELGQYADCIKIIYKKHTPDFFILKMKAYYRNGEPYKVIKESKKIIFTHWSSLQKGEIYSLLASSYEWMGERANYVSYFKKAQQILKKEQNEAYYDLMRKVNMVYDYNLPEFSDMFSKSLNFFKERKDYRKCAWVLHNWGTECVLNIKNCDEGLKKLKEAAKYLNNQLSMDKIDVENSIAIYYMTQQKWKEANNILTSIQGKSNLNFCNIVYLLNKFHCVRKMDLQHECEKILQELDDMLKSINQIDDIKLQIQNYFVSKGIYLLEQKNYSEALTLFAKALRYMDEKYYSYYTAVAAHNIVELSNKGIKIDSKILRLAERNSQSSNPAVLKMVEYNITFAEIMFWN